MATKKLKTNPSALSQKALLVSVNIGQWTGRRVDKRATDTANIAHKAKENAGKYHKKLLPNAVELEAIGTIGSQVRKYFYEQTLPWMADGSRIIAGKNYLNFVSKMRAFKVEFENAVKDFETAYPRLKKEAIKTLGDLYDKDEYPDDIASKFNIEATYLPLPDVGDFRTEITDAEKKQFIAKMRDVEGDAMRDCWTRLHTVVKTAADKLAQPDAIFRDSLIENITEIVNLLPMLNITDDKDLEKQRRDIQKVIGNLDSSDLREDVLARAKASKALSDIESKMGAFMRPSKK